MMAVPAATAVLGTVPQWDASDGGAKAGASELPSPSGFWMDGGNYDVIVVFSDPCVVQRRIALEASGVTDPAALASASRTYKGQIEAQHETFMRYVQEQYPEVQMKMGFTTVLNGMALTASGEALDHISHYAGVDRIEPDTEVKVALDDSVPLVNGDDMWAELNGTGLNITGQGMVVAVLDTGIDYSHPDLGGTSDRTADLAKIAAGTHPRIVGGWNIINDTADFWDGHFHGTHCAGIVGANGTVVGMAPECDFLIYKVLSDGGYGATSGVIAGIELATDPDDDGDTSDHADVLSLSLGGFGHPDDAKCEAVDNSMAAGAVVAVAAVNDGPDYETIGSPGCARDVISVGATSKNDYLASFSSIGPTAIYQIKPDLTGPGLSIYSTSRYNGYRYASGTSMATPHVAGAAALLTQSHPDWTSTQVKAALMGTAKDVGYNEYRQGTGRFDVLKANNTDLLADPPSVSLGRLSATNTTTTFKVEFENLASGWTNATLSWKFRWELTPLYTSSGNNTDLSSMITANTTAVNITGGSKFTVKFTLTYDQNSDVGHHLGEISLSAGGDTIRVPLAFYIRAPVLLVDDDNSDDGSSAPYNNHNPYTSLWFKTLGSSEDMGSALYSLGVSFDVEAVRTWYDGPDQTDLSQYRVVIWNCGFDYAPYGETLTSEDVKAIKGYTDAGGNIWLSGTLVLYDLYGATNKTNLGTSDNMRSIFGMGGFTRYSGTPDPLKGTAGTFMAGESYDVDTAIFGNRDYGSNLTPVDGANQVLTGSDTDYWGASWSNITSGIARDSGLNKTVFTAFEFGQIRLSADKEDLVDEILTWIDLSPHGAVSYTGDLKEGSDINFSGRVLDKRATESYVFEWDFDYDGSTFAKDDTGQQVTHSYDDDGNFTVGLRIQETRTGTTSPTVTTLLDVINQAPEAHINTSSPGEEGSPVSFWGNATDPGGNDTFTYEWDFDYDGQTFNVDSTSRNATHTYLDDGTFTVALTVTDDEGLTSQINTTIVRVVNLPPSGSPFTPGTADEGEVVPFTATVDDPSPLDTVTVYWDFEYSGTFNEMANGTSVSHVYQDDGSYNVMMRMVDDDGGVANVTLVVLVRNVAPTANFTTSAPADEGDVVDLNSTFSDPGTHDTHNFEWDFDYDGNTFDVQGTRQNVSWQFYQDGNYTVALRVTDDDGGSVIVTEEVEIRNVRPTASIESMGPVDEGETVRFMSDFSDPGRYDQMTYLWDFGDGGTSKAQHPFHMFADDGTFTISLTVTDDAGGLDTVSVDLLVSNVAPNATYKGDPDHIQENGEVYFQAEGRDPSSIDEANLTYTWNFGDGESSNLKEVYHTYLNDGSFSVTLTVQDDDGGVATYTLGIEVENVAPSVEAGADREYISEGEAINFTAIITDPGTLDTHTALWDFDDGATSDQLQVTHRFADNGNFIVVLTVTDDSGGTNTTTFRVAVSNVRPIITASSNATEIEEGDSVSFTVDWTDPGVLDEHTVVWDFGDGTDTADQNPTHRFMQDGTYTVLVTVTDDDGGQATKPFIIEVDNVAPVPTISVSITQIAENETVQFAASAVDKGPLDTVTFHWDFGDDSDPLYINDATPIHRYLDNGVYRVTLRAIDSDGAISSPAAVSITVNNLPPKNLRASADLTVTTVGKAVTFSAWAEDDSPEDEILYTWNFGDLTTSTEQTTSHIYHQTNSYDVVLIVSDDDGGQTRWDVTIEVKPDMDGDAIPDDEDKDRDGDGIDNNDDDFPDDPERYRNWTPIYLGLLVVVVVVVAVAAYVMRPKSDL